MNKFNILQETSEKHRLNAEYKNIVIVSVEAAAEYVQTKPRSSCKFP